MNYENEICSGCGRRFQEGDDIVTCPECGTPQHRECWLLEHKCVNEHLHEDGFEWKPKHRNEQPENKEEQVRTRPCPFCGYENPVDAKECANCSQPFEMFGRSIFPKEEEQPHTEEKKKEKYSYKPPFEVSYDEPKGDDERFNPFSQNQQSGTPSDSPMQQFIADAGMYEKTILGEDTRDLAAYVRMSLPAYYKKFKKVENGKKSTFNFAAFLFGPLWFFFRKLYKAGFLFTVIALCLTMAFQSPMTEALEGYYDLASQIEKLTQEGGEVDEAKAQQLVDRLYDYSVKNLPVMALFGLSQLLLHLAAGVLADILYRKKFLSDIKEIGEASQGIAEQRQILIMRKGGVSVFLPIVAYAAMQFIPSLLVQVFFK